MQFCAIFALQTLPAIANRQHPVRSHLHIVIEGFHCLIVKGVTGGIFIARGPNQRFVSIGKARAPEIRHRIGFAPDNVVQHPIPKILQRCADAENIVIAANHP